MRTRVLAFVVTWLGSFALFVGGTQPATFVFDVDTSNYPSVVKP